MKSDHSVRERKSGLNPEKPKLRHRLGKYLGRAALVGTLLLGPADLATSDIVGAKILQIVEHDVHITPDKPLNHTLQDGIIGGYIFAESALLAGVVSRSKKVRGSFIAYDEMRTELKNKNLAKNTLTRRTWRTSTKPFRAAGRGILEGFAKVGQAGEKLSASKRAPIKAAGNILRDTALVNTVGTTFVSLDETSKNHPPKAKRVAALSGLIAGSWLVEAEGARSLSRGVSNIPGGHDFIHAVGEVWNLATPDFTRPLTPGSIVLAGVAAALAYKGWYVSKYQEEHPELFEDKQLNQLAGHIAPQETI